MYTLNQSWSEPRADTTDLPLTGKLAGFRHAAQVAAQCLPTH